ncbi:hypothetical protein CR513_30175, partial [Mucuna pruriens]
MQLPTCWLQECFGSLYGFAREFVPIRGTVELETSFGEQSGIKAIPVLYTIMDAPASYNIIIGRPTLNRLRAFPVGRTVGSVWADSHVAQRYYEDSLKVGARPPVVAINALELDLDPRCRYEHDGPYQTEELKEIQLGPLPD